MKKICLNLFVMLQFAVLFVNAQWQATYLPAQYWPANDIETHNGLLYVAGNDGVFSSSDNGATWSDLTNGFATSSSNAFAELAFTGAGDIYARTTVKGIVRSTDGGSTWSYDTANIGFNYDIAAIYYDSVSDKLFAGLGWPKYGLYTKQTADPAWTQITSPAFPANFSPVQITRKGSKLFVYGVNKIIYESSDNGSTWLQKNSTSLTDASSQVGPGRFLAIGNDLYLGQGGVWKSSDDGDNWTRIDTGFALSFGMFVDTRCLYYDGSNLHAGVYAGGETYSSPDLGVTWNYAGNLPAFAKAMLLYNGTLYATAHGIDSVFVYGGSLSAGEILSDTRFSIFPNPASAVVTVKCDNGQVARIELFDVTGRKVCAYLADKADAVSIDVSAFGYGVYYLKMISGTGKVYTRKIIIE